MNDLLSASSIVAACAAPTVGMMAWARRRHDATRAEVASTSSAFGGVAGIAAAIVYAYTAPAPVVGGALAVAASAAALAAPLAWAFIRHRTPTWQRPAWSGMGRPPGRTSDVRMFRRRRRRRSVRTYQEVKP